MADRESFEIAIGAVRLDPLEAEEELKKSSAGRPSAADGEREAGARNPQPWIVQFHSALAENEIARLRAQFGLRLTEYLPNLAYVEQLAPDGVAALRNDPLVRATLAYRPEFKLAPTLDKAPETLPNDTDESGGRPVLLVLFYDVDLERMTAQLTGAGLSDPRVLDDRPIGGIVRVLATAPNRNSIMAAARLPEVRWIEPVAPLVTNDVGAAATIQSGDASNPQFWDKGLHGERQVIGIIDNGPPDIKHCFFCDPDADDNTPGPTHRKILDLRNLRITGTGEHATFVAGCLAGDEIGNLGAAPHRGGAWAAKLAVGNMHDLRAFSNPNDAQAQSLLSELTAASAVGAKIHSNSWFEPAGNPPLYSDIAAEVDRFTWKNQDQLVLGSAGTDGSLGAPGTAKNAICVAAAEADPNELTLCDGASGPTLDGRRKPDLVAVGSGIKSAKARTACETGFYIDGNSCATSWATPHAAAAAALVRQYFTEGWYPTGGKEPGHAMPPSGALLKAVLLACTINMSGPDYPNDREGFGLVRLNRGLHFLDTGATVRLQVFDVLHENGLGLRDIQSRSIVVTAPVQPLKIVLTYSDAPGPPGIGRLVNNLNLVVTAPDGAEFLGNHFVNGESAIGGSADDQNNVEVVLLPTPQAGTYTIKVVGSSVPVPRQGYALAVLGSLNLKSCFVASAVYGNSEHPNVQVLRDWRDAHLAPGARGRMAMQALVRGYALVGPPMARLVDAHPWFAKLVRERVLAPFVARLADGTGRRYC
jgi:hypothetical protein